MADQSLSYEMILSETPFEGNIITDVLDRIIHDLDKVPSTKKKVRKGAKKCQLPSRKTSGIGHRRHMRESIEQTYAFANNAFVELKKMTESLERNLKKRENRPKNQKAKSKRRKNSKRNRKNAKRQN